MACIINAKFLSQNITGTQQVGIGLSKHLKNQLQNTSFVTTKHVIHKDIANQLAAVSIGDKNNVLWEQYELPLFLKKNKNPLLIDFGNTAPVLYKNKITIIHDISPFINPEWFSFKNAMYFQFLIRSYIKNSRKIVVVSEYTKQTIVEYFKINESYIDVIYPACPDEILLQENIKLENNFGEYILAVSSIDPRKNFKGLIKAFKLAKLKGLKLLIVGSESRVFANQDLKGEIGENSSIIFTGYVSTQELITLYKNALFFIYPSFFEGFGIPPLEAMKCGCPTIVSKISSLPEVCGDASLYIDPYNIDSIVDAIKHLYNSPTLRENLRVKGYQQCSLYSWSQSALKLTKLIRSME